MPHTPNSYDSFQVIQIRALTNFPAFTFILFGVFLKAFLDENQYTEEGIRRYEFIFGTTFVSTGGQETTAEFVKSLNLEPGHRLLDVGCGIGGSAFHIARTYGTRVHGVDLSSNMVSMAVKYQAEMEDNVRKNVSIH